MYCTMHSYNVQTLSLYIETNIVHHCPFDRRWCSVTLQHLCDLYRSGESAKAGVSTHTGYYLTSEKDTVIACTLNKR